MRNRRNTNMENFKFNDLVYERPDFDQMGKEQEERTERLKNAASYEEAKKIFLENDEASKKLMTMCTIGSIRHTLDTTDEFYEKRR